MFDKLLRACRLHFLGYLAKCSSERKELRGGDGRIDINVFVTYDFFSVNCAVCEINTQK